MGLIYPANKLPVDLCAGPVKFRYMKRSKYIVEIIQIKQSYPIVTIIAKVKNKKYVRNKVGRSRPLVLENSSFRLIVLPQFYMSILQKPYSIYYNSRRYISTTIPLTVRSA